MMFELCPATGGRHCRCWRAGVEPCCACGKKLLLGDELEIPDEVREALEADAREEARREGCTCEPEVTIAPIGALGGLRVTGAVMNHDDDCALMQRLARAANAPNN